MADYPRGPGETIYHLTRMERIDATLKNLPDETQAEIYELRHPTDGEKPTAVSQILAMLPELAGFSVSKTTLYDFFAWYNLKMRMRAADCRARQLVEELSRNADLDPREISRAGQRMFAAEAAAERDLEGFVKVDRLALDWNKSDRDERRLEILEANEKRRQAAEDKIASIQDDEKLSEEEQRKLILDHMDEFFGLKKK